jgi:hypothetical protein
MKLILLEVISAVLVLLFAQTKVETGNLVQVTPVEFFSGDLKRLQPHLDLG